jgi:hypothetical protein
MSTPYGEVEEGAAGRDALVSAEALVRTEHADRYIAQLTRHAHQMGRHFGSVGKRHPDGAPPQVSSVESSDAQATLTFAEGRCLVWARPDGLKLRVEAGDDQRLRRLEDGVAKRIQTLGSRERLEVQWSR